MKKLMALTMTVSLLSSMAFGQGMATSTNKLRKKAPSESALNSGGSYLANGFNVGFEYMGLNSSEMDSKSKITGTVQKGIKQSTEGKQMGAKFGYKQIKRSGIGMDINISLLKLTNKSEEAQEFTNVMPAANLTLGASQYVYGALGVNTSFVLGDNSMTYSPRIGYQAGGGVVFAKNFNFEVFYSWVNVGAETQYALMESRMTSTNARLIYVF